MGTFCIAVIVLDKFGYEKKQAEGQGHQITLATGDLIAAVSIGVCNNRKAETRGQNTRRRRHPRS
jgi:hypothetical protein